MVCKNKRLKEGNGKKIGGKQEEEEIKKRGRRSRKGEKGKKEEKEKEVTNLVSK